MPFGQNSGWRAEKGDAETAPADSCKLARRELAIVDVRAGESDRKEAIRIVSDLVDEHDGRVEKFLSHVVLATFRNVIAGEAFRTALRDRYGDRVRVLYGNCVSMQARFGEKTLLNYAFFIPGLTEAMEVLAGMEYGVVAAHHFRSGIPRPPTRREMLESTSAEAVR